MHGLAGVILSSRKRTLEQPDRGCTDGFVEVTRSFTPAAGDGIQGRPSELRTITCTSADGLDVRERTSTPYLRQIELPLFSR